MIGAIIGDIVGSRFEFNSKNIEPGFTLYTKDCSYTDDTICTVAIADALLNHKDYGQALREWCRKYPDPMGGYGSYFQDWWESDDRPGNPSCGNGAAMRISPVGWLVNDYHEMLNQAKLATICSHNHPEAIKGAQCVATLIYWFRNGRITKEDLEHKMEKHFKYEMPDLKDIMRIGRNGHFDSTCQETVPWAVRCFIESNDFEGALRNAILTRGDTDTKAAVTCSIAGAFYVIPDEIISKAMSYLPGEMIKIIEQFCDKVQEEI